MPNTKPKQGKLIVFSAPSGSGKTTIVRHLLKQEALNLAFSISATSREPRGEEAHAKDYYFLSAHDFKQHIKHDDFLEWEEVYRDNFYGTLKSEVERLWACNLKAKEILNWTPVYEGRAGFVKGLEETITWFSNSKNLKSYKTNIYNI